MPELKQQLQGLVGDFLFKHRNAVLTHEPDREEVAAELVALIRAGHELIVKHQSA